jgi:ABC-2 type transport system permease protein
MKKIIAVAVREYRAMVGTKAFLVGMLMMPLLMFGSIVAMRLLQNSGAIVTQKILIVDQTGKLFESLNQAAMESNEAIDKAAENQAADSKLNQENNRAGESVRKRFELESWSGAAFTDEDRLALSERIRKQELHAFVEIPSNILAIPGEAVAESTGPPTALFYSEDSSFSEARSWFNEKLNTIVRKMRIETAGLDEKKIEYLIQPVTLRGLGPAERTSDGAVAKGEEREIFRDMFLPLGIMMLMFMVIFMSAQPMLESVLEEKAARIAEVLLGSVNAWQLMTGKLLGTVGGSLTILAVYVGGTIGMVIYKGWMDQVPFGLIPWFLVYQILGVLFFASIFMAVGASVSQLKEAQALLLPVWMLMMSPMFVWLMIVREPNSTMSTLFSFFPPATPTVMALRMSTDATIAWWQPPAAALLLVISTFACIWLAARIFRVGLLWQGKTPKLTELLRWAFSG